MWVDQRTGSEFNVEIGARVVATQAGQIVLIDDDGQVPTSYSSYFSHIYLNHSILGNFIFLSKLNFVPCMLVPLKV